MNVKPKFKLKKKDSETPTSIRLLLYFNKRRFMHGTGKLILPTLWDEATERPTTNQYQIKKAKVNDPEIKTNLSNLNTYLNNVSDEVKRYFALMEQQGEVVTPEILRTHLEEKFKGVEKPISVKETLNQYIIRYIEEIKTGKRLTDKGRQYTKGTIKNYVGFQVQFDEYQKANHKKLDFEDITLDFYDDFVFYFNEKNYSPNTIWRHIKQLNAIMRAAAEEKIHSNM